MFLLIGQNLFPYDRDSEAQPAPGALITLVLVDVGKPTRRINSASVIPFHAICYHHDEPHPGISANLMSMGALDFGLIVDGAVIIVKA
jgi:cobalt-zinc-cadmium resistance protein CzcA